MSLLEISQLRKSFFGPDGSEHKIIDIQHFSLAAKAQVGLEGESGAGKSTCLHLIAGILKPDSGKVLGSTNPAAASAATRSKTPESVMALDSRSVSIRGFLLPLRMNNNLTIEFLLMRNQNMCCFGSVPAINEWIAVAVLGEGVKPIMVQPDTVRGQLRVGEIRENGYLVGIYRMKAEQIVMPQAN